MSAATADQRLHVHLSGESPHWQVANGGGQQYKMVDEGGDHTTPAGGAQAMCKHIDVNYDIAPAVICAFCFVFGILYCFFGEYC